MAEVTIVQVPTQLVLGVQRQGHYSEIAAALGEVVHYAMANGAQLRGMPVAIMHETSKGAAEKADREGTAVIDVAFPIAKPVQGSDAVKCYELAGGKMAKTVHKGLYDACGPAYEALFEWLAKNGLKLAGLPREVSLSDPRTVAPENLLMEIYAPVE